MINRLTGSIYDRLVQAKTPYRIQEERAYNETTTERCRPLPKQGTVTAYYAAGSSEMMTIRCICTDKPKCEYYISYIAGEILREWGTVRLRSSFFGA